MAGGLEQRDENWPDADMGRCEEEDGREGMCMFGVPGEGKEGGMNVQWWSWWVEDRGGGFRGRERNKCGSDGEPVLKIGEIEPRRERVEREGCCKTLL